MFTIGLAILAGLSVGTLFKLTFVHSIWGAMWPGLLAAIVVAALLFRRAAQQLEPLIKTVEKHLTGNRRELAIKTLREGLELGKWHPLLPGQLRVQIGALHYVAGDLDEAEAELSKASRFPWISRAFLACVYFKKKEADKMKKAFESALKSGEKEGILYTLYAHCLIGLGLRDDGAALLERGLKKIEGKTEAQKVERGRLENNLELAKQGKKLKTAPYGDAWSRFQLDGAAPPVMAGPGGKEIPKFARGYNPRPGFRQRPQKRK